MKKKLFFAALAAVAFILGLTSCSGDKENEVPETPTVKATLKLDPATNADFIGVCDMNVAFKITDGNGKIQTGNETITAVREWKDVVCPCSFTFTYTFAPKTASIVENQKYTVEYAPYFYVSSDNDSQRYGAKRTTTLYDSLLKNYLEILANREREVTITVNDKGIITTNNNGDEHDEIDDFETPKIEYGGDDSNNNDKTAQ